MTTITHLECAACGKRYEAGQIHNLCECGGPLLVAELEAKHGPKAKERD